MEAFLVALVLVAALAVGSGLKSVNSHMRPNGESGAKEEWMVKGKPSVSVCTPDHPPIIQRDLTMPIRNSVDKDGR